MSRACPPVALSFAAHDPTVGAGLSADLAVFAALGCQPAGVLTGITAQDSAGVHAFESLTSDWVHRQASVLLADFKPAVFKAGALCSPEVVAAVARTIAQFPGVPFVLDPVIASGRGDALGREGMREALVSLMPLVSVVTPNVPEALLLTGADTGQEAASRLLDWGARAVLLTGTHDESTGDEVVNILYISGENAISHRCLRLPGHYHGSGCTLASSLAAFLAQGQAMQSAAVKALRYTWETLVRANRPGVGQAIPDRLLGRHWADCDFSGKQ